MDALTARQCFLLAVVVYGVSMVYSVFLWRRGFRRDDHVNYVLLFLGFVLHTAAMAQRALAFHRCPVKGVLEATLFLTWALVAAYLLVGLLPRLRFLGAFASPGLFAVGVFVVMFWNDPVFGPQPELSGPEFSGPLKTFHRLMSVHAALALLAYGAFGLGAVAAVMYLTQERDLKFHKLKAILSLMPPIQRLEATAARLLLSGFILLTIGLGIGVYVLAHVKNPLAYRHDPKVVWSMVVWLLYLVLVVMRWMAASRRFLGGILLLGIGLFGLAGGVGLAGQEWWQRLIHLVICLTWMGFGLVRLRWRFALAGRRFAWGGIAVFFFVLLTFWIFILLSPLHHP